MKKFAWRPNNLYLLIRRTVFASRNQVLAFLIATTLHVRLVSSSLRGSHRPRFSFITLVFVAESMMRVLHTTGSLSKRVSGIVLCLHTIRWDNIILLSDLSNCEAVCVESARSLLTTEWMSTWLRANEFSMITVRAPR